MTDNEVFRLRQLRNNALEVRAISRALRHTPALRAEPVLEQVACAAWRLSRTISGRLAAHPYLSFQRGATTGELISHSAAGLLARVGSIAPERARRNFVVRLRKLARDVADARALTLTLDLSDSFARSKAELLTALRTIELGLGITVGGTAVGEPSARVAARVLRDDHPYLAF